LLRPPDISPPRATRTSILAHLPEVMMASTFNTMREGEIEPWYLATGPARPHSDLTYDADGRTSWPETAALGAFLSERPGTPCIRRDQRAGGARSAQESPRGENTGATRAGFQAASEAC
ncbi:MAG: hypothetical protein KDB53_14905, partial [Planctomycetes bacterium]|nr:hypothetical protein [Planctomycetota bacterium]